MSTKNSNNLNSIRKFLFTPFKQSRIYFSIVNALNLILIVVCGFKHNFTASDLSTLAQLTLNLVFVIGAIGLTIFSLKLDTNNSFTQSKETKKNLAYSYIGLIFLNSSIAITSYILSLIDFGSFINKWYSIIALVVLLRSITSTLNTIITYFNIKD